MNPRVLRKKSQKDVKVVAARKLSLRTGALQFIRLERRYTHEHMFTVVATRLLQALVLYMPPPR